ncbi:MAG: hypothetical protein ACFFD4_33795 [Candidatus Odinarchaeota archaeon]
MGRKRTTCRHKKKQQILYYEAREELTSLSYILALHSRFQSKKKDIRYLPVIPALFFGLHQMDRPVLLKAPRGKILFLNSDIIDPRKSRLVFFVNDEFTNIIYGKRNVNGISFLQS